MRMLQRQRIAVFVSHALLSAMEGMEGLDMCALAVLFAVPPMAVALPTEVVPVAVDLPPEVVPVATPGGGDLHGATPGADPVVGEWWLMSVDPVSEGDERIPEEECPAVCSFYVISLFLSLSKGGRATARFYCEVEQFNDMGEFLIQDLEENAEPEWAVRARFIERVAPEEVPEWVQLGPKFKFTFDQNWQQRITEITADELFGDEPAT